jgi:two-component system chemotaxis response regulator CheB
MRSSVRDTVDELSDEQHTGDNPSHVVAIGCSAGGVDALSELVDGLAADTTAAIVVVLHLARSTPSVLHRILARRCTLPVHPAADGQALRGGQVLVAIPDHHVIVEGGVVRVVAGPQENGHRPAIDPLFRSAALWWGDRSVGVVLTGALDDGTDGLRAIREAGGLALVQDPREASVPAMPEHALRAVPDAETLRLSAIAKRISALRPVSTRRPLVEPRHVDHPDLAAEADVSAGQTPPLRPVGDPAAAGLSCPDCGGSLYEIRTSPITRYRCRVGHGWTADALMSEHDHELERALWMAMRIIEDDIALQERLVARAVASGRGFAAERIVRRLDERKRLRESLHDSLRKVVETNVDE